MLFAIQILFTCTVLLHHIDVLDIKTQLLNMFLEMT